MRALRSNFKNVGGISESSDTEENMRNVKETTKRSTRNRKNRKVSNTIQINLNDDTLKSIESNLSTTTASIDSTSLQDNTLKAKRNKRRRLIIDCNDSETTSDVSTSTKTLNGTRNYVTLNKNTKIRSTVHNNTLLQENYESESNGTKFTESFNNTRSVVASNRKNVNKSSSVQNNSFSQDNCTDLKCTIDTKCTETFNNTKNDVALSIRGIKRYSNEFDDSQPHESTLDKNKKRKSELQKSLSENYDHVILDNSISFCQPVNVEESIIQDKFVKTEKRKSELKKKFCTSQDFECITIEDSIFESDKSNNSTFITQEDTNFESHMKENFDRRATFEVKNQSGDWMIEDISSATEDGSILVFSDKKERVSHTNPNEFVFFENVPNIFETTCNETFDSPTKLNRKKWVKFETNTNSESPLLKNSSYTELKSSKKLLTSSPIQSKNTLKNTNRTPANSSSGVQQKSTGKKDLTKRSFVNTIDSASKSNSKNGIKPTAMPNFTLIHQKAFDKMESLKEYSERKKQRMKMLISNEKKVDKENKKIFPASSRQLFGKETQSQVVNSTNKKHNFGSSHGSQSYNRFGFKIDKLPEKNIGKNKPTVVKTFIPTLKEKLPPKEIKQAPVFLKIQKPKLYKQSPVFSTPKLTEKLSMFSKVKEPEKTSVFSRSNIIAAANKTKIQEKLGNRNNRRDELKGVRTNRRFDLLMQMRNK